MRLAWRRSATCWAIPLPRQCWKTASGEVLARRDDLVLVAEHAAGHVLGWVHASVQDPLESDRCCEILGLVVDAAHQGHGVGRRLVEAVEEWASQQAIDHMTVRSNVVRTGSHPFYERLGYGRVKTQHVYRKRLADSIDSHLPTPEAEPR